MVGKPDATAADPGDAPFERYATLGQTRKGRVACLERDLHVPWIGAIGKLERQRNAVIDGRREFIGNRSWWNRRLIRTSSSHRSAHGEIGPGSRNRAVYLGFPAIGDDSMARGRCRVRP